MRVLFDIAHPAHAHFFRFVCLELRKRGHEVVIVTRDKEMTEALLRSFGLTYRTVSRPLPGAMGQIAELFMHWFRVWRVIRAEKVDLAVSIAGLFTAIPAFFAGIPDIMETDTEDARLSNAISRRFSRLIVTPKAFLHDLGRRHRRYNGYHELAYTHPRWFSPDAGVLRKYALEPGSTFWVIRTVRWGALHDIGEHGFSEEALNRLILRLGEYGPVIVSQELPMTLQGATRLKDPTDVHHLLAFCRAYIGESPTMAMEAAILGRPAWLVSSRARKLGYIMEMEDRYGLIRSFHGENVFMPFLAALLDEVASGEAKRQDGRRRMFEEKVDVVRWFADLIEEVGGP